MNRKISWNSQPQKEQSEIKDTYTTYCFNKLSDETQIDRPYENMMPSEFDIFSLVKNSVDINEFPNKDDIYEFIAVFKKILYSYIKYKKFTGVLNKFVINIIDDACVLQWNYLHFRIYFSFEKTPSESFYGIVVDNQIDGEYYSRSGKLVKELYSQIITEIVQLVLEHV